MENRVHSAIAAKKNLNLFNRLNRVRQFAMDALPLRYLCATLLFLTLSMGQMWAAPYVKLDVSTGKQGTKTVGDKLNGGSEWWYNYQTNGGWSSATDIQVLIGTSTSSYSTVNASWYADSGSDKKVHADIGSFTFDKSGIWYAVGKYKSSSTTAYTSGTSFTNNTSLSTSMTTSNSPYWEVTPPSVKSFTVSTAGSDILSGTGTSADPYIISYNGSLVLTLSGSKNKTDANSSLQYYTNSTWNTTTSRTISSITSTTKTSVTVNMRCYNSTASLSGTVSSKTIYYQAEASYDVKVATITPTAGGSATPTSWTTMGATSGGDITATPNTGYSFDGWSILSGGGGYFGTSGTATTSSTASTKFRPTKSSSLKATFTPNSYTFTLNGNGGSDGSITIKYDADAATTLIDASRAGYSLNGYYTASSGGNKVINANGSLNNVSGWVSGGYWKQTDETQVLYAQWTENAVYYGVTYAVHSSGHGSLSAANTSTSAAIASGTTVLSGTGVTFTASPSTGYTVDGWFSNEACTSPIVGAGTGNTYSTTISAATSVYVKFKEKTWSVAFAAGTGGTVTTPNSTPRTVGQVTGITIAATPNTGYTFNTWTVSSGSGSFTSGASTNSNTFKPTAASTVTASFNETKSTITVTTATSSQGTLKFGSTDKSWGTTASLGVATTQSITATAAAGFTFVRWDLSGAAATASSTTSATITLKADGSGDTGTATAVFAEDLSSPWIVAGGNKIVSGDTWRTKADANNSMVKKTGHSTESIVYFTVPITTVCSGDNNENFQFKIYNTSTSKWYGLFASGSYYLLKAEDGTEKTLLQDNANIELRAYVTGDYVFKLDYSTSTPKLTVTWPVFNQVRISNASPTDATNTGNFDLSAPVSNVRTVTRSLKANTTYTFKIMYNSDWYGYNSGTFTRNNSTSSNSRTISTSGGDMTLTTDYAGDYTFKFNESTKALSVDFPEAYKVTYGKGTVDGSASNCSAVDLDNGSAAVTSNSTWVKSGNRVKLSAPTEATGYTFDGWFNNNSGTGDAITTAKNCTITVSSAQTYYACYHEHKTSITITTDGHGTITTPSPNNSPYSLGVATMQNINASPNTGYSWNTWTTSGNAALNSSATTQSNKAKGNGTAGGSGTVTATFTAKTYDVTLNVNGGSGANQTVTATYDAAMPTTLKGGGAIAARTRTGYIFDGYVANSDGTGTKYYTSALANNHIWDQDVASPKVYAKWTPKQSALTFNYQTGDAGYKSSGTITVTSSATYDATMPALSGNVPTAKDGYAFIGFFDGTDSGAKKYYNADKSSAATWDKDTESSTTLYAHYKKAEITELTFVSGTVAPNAVNGVKVTPVVDPALGSIGTVHIDWRVLYDNDDPLTDQPAQTAYNTTGIQFNAPESSGTYKVEATLRTGATANAGTVISTTKALFVVAGNHTVTLKYMSGSYTIQPSTTIGGTPLDWTEITAPTLVGYTFANWTLGEGITIDTSDGKSVNDATIYFKASYDGTLTANYTKKKMIYFNNTVGWSDVYVYFYNSDRYWSNATNASGSIYASGAKINEDFGGYKPYTGEHGHMTRIEGTDVWYFDYQAELIPDRTVVTFTEGNQHGYQFFNDTKVVRAFNFNPSYMPMYVPLAEPVAEYNKHDGVKADYYEKGYWMNYPDYTGYWLKMFNKKSNSDAPDAGSAPVTVKDIPFGFSADMAMPLSVKVDLEAGKTYGFKIYRANDASGTWYGNDGTMVSGNSGANGATPWGMWSDQSSNCGLTTTVAGEYVFTLRFAPDGEGNNHTYRVGVEYPVSVGDYRIFYKDGATWSQGTAHGVLWHHSSSVIPKNYGTEAKADTVSLFVSVGSSPSMKFQYVSAINASTGEVTWADVASGSISTPSNVTSGGAGVYNFIVNQPAGGASISLTKAEPYTGNYYIRSDVAGTTKWDNYKANDHLMQYSDYADQNETFTHSFTKYVPRGNNVKFTIANDYSPCISDTLIRDVDMSFNNMAENGTLNSDGNQDPTYDVNSANIRFMWNQKTNKINRAYIGGSAVDRFLVMLGDAKLLNESGAALDNNEIKFRDDQNFIYEVTIKAVPTAHVKVTAEYKDKVQYFKGTSAGGALTDDNSVEILGGSGSTPQKMRIVYDFKTNRLVCAWQPSGDITGEIDINADVMIIREGQGVAEQIKFTTNESKLGQVKNVYGVMCFNRWTLANKNKDSHNPLPDGSTASIAERRMYFISFPFDVNLGDIFGLGAYDDHWWIQYYDGKARAKECFWAESKGFWKFLENTPGAKLKANEGYILTLGSEMLRSDNTDIWVNNIDQVELFFPSAAVVENIEKTDATVTLDAYTCTETRDSRNIKDSHWHCMGVPSYANYDKNVTDGSSAISWGTERWSALNVPFLYNWNKVDNTLTVHTSNDYDFQAMHAYMVQYHGDVKWSSTSVPKAVAARKRAGYKGSYEFRLELQKDGVMTDQTYVNLTDDEQATKAFDFNLDLSKEGSTRSTICTVTSDAIPVAGNSMPLETESTTVVPVSVSIKADGEYTFAMPDGTEGMVVTLVDNETNMHTNLALGTYTLELTAGTYEGRFALEIDPRNAPTTIDIIGGKGEDATPRKVFINGLMYILRGDKVFDANGRVIQ